MKDSNLNQSQLVEELLYQNCNMYSLVHQFDWSSTSIGAMAEWPCSLRTLVFMLLRAKFPILLMWGSELIHIYNDAFRLSLGTLGKHPKALGSKAVDVWPEIWDTRESLFKQIMTGGESFWQEDALVPIFRNGKIEEAYWTFSYSAVTNDKDCINGILVVCSETTEKVVGAKKIDIASDFLSFAVDAAELGTWDLNPKTNKFTGNARLKEWFGLDEEADIDVSQAINAILKKDKERVTAAIKQALQFSSKGQYEIEYSIINNFTKQIRVVKAKGRAIFNDDQQPIRFNGTLQDITAEVTARVQRQKLLTLVDNSVDLMSILELDGKNSYINAAGREILGIDPDADVTVIPISDFHTTEQIMFVETEIIPNVMGKGTWAGQFAIRNRKTGEIIPLFNNCHRINDPFTGEPIGVGAVMRDMRPELNVKQELENKVAERTKELQAANKELEIRNEELASFTFVSSHDLQEPLRKINAFISRIEETGIDDMQPNILHYFERIKAAADRMQNLISDLLSYSHIGTSNNAFVPTDLNSVLAEVLSELQFPIRQSQAEIQVGNLPILNIVKFQFHQLFVNLISNAIKFSKKDLVPFITITSSILTGSNLDAINIDTTKEYWHITVEDNGIGFEPKYNHRIFDVFQRLHSRSEYEGTGIGLAICKKVILAHGGLITAEGNPNKGACFHLYLPVSLNA